jgi:hypothetical protein
MGQPRPEKLNEPEMESKIVDALLTQDGWVNMDALFGIILRGNSHDPRIGHMAGADLFEFVRFSTYQLVKNGCVKMVHVASVDTMLFGLGPLERLARV